MREIEEAERCLLAYTTEDGKLLTLNIDTRPTDYPYATPAAVRAMARGLIAEGYEGVTVTAEVATKTELNVDLS